MLIMGALQSDFSKVKQETGVQNNILQSENIQSEKEEVVRLLDSEPLKIIQATSESEDVLFEKEENDNVPFRDSYPEHKTDSEPEIVTKASPTQELGFQTVDSKCFEEGNSSSIVKQMPSVLLMNERHIINEEGDLYQSVQ